MPNAYMRCVELDLSRDFDLDWERPVLAIELAASEEIVAVHPLHNMPGQVLVYILKRPTVPLHIS